jgi:uncharacterized protein (DUF952 family)
MRQIYHLVSRGDWEKQRQGPFKAESLKSEGFIHCANREQVVTAANKFYEKERDLILLTIDAELLTSLLCDEDSGSGERFPHIYGPIDRKAIAKVEDMRRDARGDWSLPG